MKNGRYYLFGAIAVLYGLGYLTHITKETWLFIPNLILTIGGVIGLLITAALVGLKNAWNGNGNGNGKK